MHVRDALCIFEKDHGGSPTAFVWSKNIRVAFGDLLVSFKDNSSIEQLGRDNGNRDKHALAISQEALHLLDVGCWMRTQESLPIWKKKICFRFITNEKISIFISGVG